MNTERTSSPNEGMRQAEAYLTGIEKNRAELNDLLRMALLIMADAQMKKEEAQKAIEDASRKLETTRMLIIEGREVTDEVIEYTRSQISVQELTPQDYERGRALLATMADVAQNLNNLNTLADEVIKEWGSSGQVAFASICDLLRHLRPFARICDICQHLSE